jgi:hypothetical protein
MWRVNITCDGEVWKRYGAEFKIIAGNYQSKLIGSKKNARWNLHHVLQN